jgi:hypothetical protein
MFKSIHDFTPDKNNARRATQRSRQAEKDSIDEYGARRSILLDAAKRGFSVPGGGRSTLPMDGSWDGNWN